MKTKTKPSRPDNERKKAALAAWRLAKDIVKGLRVRAGVRAGKHAY